MLNSTLEANLLAISLSLLDTEIKDKNHFTFIVSRNKILSIGRNKSFKSHPLGSKYGYRFQGIHSELDAYLKLPRNIDLKKCKMINIRLSRKSLRYKSPILRMAKPCSCCTKWITKLGLHSIIYSDVDGSFQFLE